MDHFTQQSEAANQENDIRCSVGVSHPNPNPEDITLEEDNNSQYLSKPNIAYMYEIRIHTEILQPPNNPYGF